MSRAGPARHGLQWVNGAPRAGKQALLAIAARRAARRPSVRLVFQDAGPPLRRGRGLRLRAGRGERPRAGEPAAARALASARRGDWAAAVGAYAEAVRLEPERASLHACLARARWRAGGRRILDVESLDDGGPELVSPR